MLLFFSYIICTVLFFVTKFINIHILLYWSDILVDFILFFKVLANFSAATNFTSFCVEYISVIFTIHYFNDLLQTLRLLSTIFLFRLHPDSLKVFWKAPAVIISLLSFKEAIQAYVQKILITHNKKRICLLNLLNNCISCTVIIWIKLKETATLIFWNFLLVLCIETYTKNPLSSDFWKLIFCLNIVWVIWGSIFYLQEQGQKCPACNVWTICRMAMKFGTFWNQFMLRRHR